MRPRGTARFGTVGFHMVGAATGLERELFGAEDPAGRTAKGRGRGAFHRAFGLDSGGTGVAPPALESTTPPRALVVWGRYFQCGAGTAGPSSGGILGTGRGAGDSEFGDDTAAAF